MAKAGITIAISGTYNGKALERARQDLEKLRIKAVGESTGAGAALVNFGGKAADLGGTIHNVGYKMEQTGTKATMGISIPIAAAATACGKAAVDMDTALTGVRKTVDGTEEQYQDLKASAIAFSKTNAVSASQIMDLQALGAQLGYNIDELDLFSEVVSGLDIATDMDAETAGTELAQFANITGMAHDKTKNYASTVVALGNNLATTESDVSHMAMRIAAAGKQCGMSEADILGLSGALSSMGISAEAGGTAISTIMSEIDKSVAYGTEGLKKYADRAGMTVDEFIGALKEDASQFEWLAKENGMTTEELQKQVTSSVQSLDTWASSAGMDAADFAAAWKKDPVKALSAVMSGLEGATKEGSNMQIMLDDLGISSIRQTDVMKRLAGNSQVLTDAVDLANDAWRENTALDNEVANRNESLAAKFEILQNRVTAAAEEVGTPLVNALLDVVDAAEPLLGAVADVAHGFSEMDEQDQQLVIGLAGAAAAFGPVTTAAGNLLQGVGDVVVGVGKASQTAGVLVSELGTVKDAFDLVRGGAGTVSEGIEMVESSTTLLSGALGVLKASVAAIAIGAVVAGIALLVEHMKELEEHQKLVNDATKGVEEAIGSAETAYQGYAEAMGTVSESTEGARKSMQELKAQTEETLQSQADLASAMSDQWAEYGTNAALVDGYAQRIAELTGRYDDHGRKIKLTKREQQELRIAVDGYNEATGASIELIDAQNGELSESTTNILANAAAFKEQARQEAALEMYKDLYEQQLKDEMALNDATKELNRLKELEKTNWDRSTSAVNPYATQIAEAQRQVDELTAALGSTATAQDQLMDVMVGSTQHFDTFEAALESSGTKLKDFGSLSDSELATLKEGFDGTLASIVTTCSTKGIEIPQSLIDAMFDHKDAVYQEGTGLGASAQEGVEKGISDNADKPKNAIKESSEDTIDEAKSTWQSHSPSKVMEQLGEDINLGLSNGITDSADKPKKSMKSLGEDVQAQVNDLPKWSKSLGSDAGGNLASGLTSTKQAVTLSGKTISDAVKGATDGLPSTLGGTGSSAGSNLAGAVRSNEQRAQQAGRALYASVDNATKQLPATLNTTGTNAGAKLASATQSNEGKARQAGRALSNAIDAETKGLPKTMQDTGRGAGSSLADSVQSYKGDATSAGRSLNEAVTSEVRSLPESMRSIGYTSGTSFVTNLSGAQAAANQAGRTIGSYASTGASSGVDGIGGVGSRAGQSFTHGIDSASAWSAGNGIAMDARSGMENVSTYYAGYEFANGFTQGMNGVNVWSVAYDIGMDALSAIKRALGIYSPSREARKVGEYFGEGAVIGMRSTEGSIEDEAERMSRAMTLNPQAGAYDATANVNGPYATVGRAGGGSTFNLYVNVTTDNREEAVQIGTDLGRSLYEEYERRARFAA